MVRQKGTLINFVGDGDISMKAVRWVLRTGKMAVGQERVMLVDRAQLIRWGLLEA